MKVFIHYPNGVDLDDLALLQQIQGRGNVVTWEKVKLTTPTEFAREHGMHPGSVTRLLKHPHCPPIEGRIGPTGRVVKFQTTLQLTAFLLEHRR